MWWRRFAMAWTAAVILLTGTVVKADIEGDRKECTEQLMAMSTCLNYVSGGSKMPTPDCCSGLKEVLKGSPKCLCLLIKDNDDPSLSLKIDHARAMSLPDDCHSPANISHCPKLLHLSPDSPDAKIFKDFGNKTATSGNSASTGAGTSALSSTTATNTTSSSSSRRIITALYPGGGRGLACWLPGLVGFWVHWLLASLS